jgi:hypothetical protein
MVSLIVERLLGGRLARDSVFFGSPAAEIQKLAAFRAEREVLRPFLARGALGNLTFAAGTSAGFHTANQLLAELNAGLEHF